MHIIYKYAIRRIGINNEFNESRVRYKKRQKKNKKRGKGKKTRRVGNFEAPCDISEKKIREQYRMYSETIFQNFYI